MVNFSTTVNFENELNVRYTLSKSADRSPVVNNFMKPTKKVDFLRSINWHN